MTIAAATNFIPASALSAKERELMGIQFLPDGRTLIKHPYRRGDGSASWKQVTIDTRDKRAIAKAMLDLAEGVEGSLTSIKFDECISTYLDEVGTGGFSNACYERAKKELGRFYSDRQNFAGAYACYCKKLTTEGFAVNTVNNYKIVVRTIANYAYKTGRAGKCAVTDYRLEHGNERNRILSPAERLSIENVLRRWDSHLLMPFLLAAENPIRKTDIFNLRREHLKCEIHNGRQVWFIEFVAKKTRRRTKNRICTLPNIGPELQEWFNNLPAGCPWLFPMIGTEHNGMHSKLMPGKWKKVIDCDRHFNSVLAEAKIYGFVFHDLKHCAITHMMRQGYSYDQLGKMGIELSPKTQRLYDNRSSVEIMLSVADRSSFVAGEGVRSAQST